MQKTLFRCEQTKTTHVLKWRITPNPLGSAERPNIPISHSSIPPVLFKNIPFYPKITLADGSGHAKATRMWYAPNAVYTWRGLYPFRDTHNNIGTCFPLLLELHYWRPLLYNAQIKDLYHQLHQRCAVFFYELLQTLTTRARMNGPWNRAREEVECDPMSIVSRVDGYLWMCTRGHPVCVYTIENNDLLHTVVYVYFQITIMAAMKSQVWF